MGATLTAAGTVFDIPSALGNNHVMTTTTTRTMLDHIGGMNILAISGGRMQALDENTLLLPVRQGYRVRVRYVPGVDLYDVERIMVRKGQVIVKGIESHLYADQVGDAAYRASCYMDSFGEHHRED